MSSAVDGIDAVDIALDVDSATAGCWSLIGGAVTPGIKTYCSRGRSAGEVQGGGVRGSNGDRGKCAAGNRPQTDFARSEG